MTTARTTISKSKQNIIELLTELHDQDTGQAFPAFIFSVMELPQVIEIIKAHKLSNLFYYLNELLNCTGDLKAPEQQEKIFQTICDLEPPGAHFSFTHFFFYIYTFDEVLDHASAYNMYPKLCLIEKLLSQSKQLNS